MMDNLIAVLHKYGIHSNSENIQAFGNGLINYTWKITADKQDYILQKLNTNVFKKPLIIAKNIQLIGNYLQKNYPNYLFVQPKNTLHNKPIVCYKKEYYRLFEFVKNSHSLEVVYTPNQAMEAATQFGLFTSNLSKLPTKSFGISLPNFHNLILRQTQFLDAIKNGNPTRIKKASSLINELQQYNYIVSTYKTILKSKIIPIRIVHHDTKISNVLFNKKDKGICVIDLDTVMPGYFISDLGDMFRTYLSPVSEEEKDFNKIIIRENYFNAIIKGYYSTMKNSLTKRELNYFLYAGEFMMYMQAIRFLTDYLNNDIYYGAKYANHNYIRAKNQAVLLGKFKEKQNVFTKSIFKLINTQ